MVKTKCKYAHHLLKTLNAMLNTALKSGKTKQVVVVHHADVEPKH